MNSIKKHGLYCMVFLALCFDVLPLSGFAASKMGKQSIYDVNDEYITSVTFPAGYIIGDYIEFVGVRPINAGSSGYYNISISYTRGNVAAAATHVASISHSDPALWRETGQVNNNGYVGYYQNFTIDCNTEYTNPRFRIRAVNTLGLLAEPLTVNIKVISINFNSIYIALNQTGNDLTVSKLLPMTAEWSPVCWQCF